MSEIEIGSVLDGRYEILSVLGSGGMGCVYKARQLRLDRLVAIKTPSAAVRENDEFMARFVREARACAKMAHDHIVAIYDVHSGPFPYIVMEFVDGMPLNQFLHEQAPALFVSDLLDIMDQICEGIAAAHERGVVHRDIKPGNIVIANNTQRVKIMDFGIARVSGETALTVSGSMMGTPYYMAPEQIRGEDVGPTADVYALSAMVYQLLTGRLVFEGALTSLMYKHVSELPRRPSELNPMLPKAVDDVLLHGLEKMPEMRPESALEFARELRMALRPLVSLPYTQIFARGISKIKPSEGEGKAPTPSADEIGERIAHSAPLHPLTPPKARKEGDDRFAKRKTRADDAFASTIPMAFEEKDKPDAAPDRAPAAKQSSEQSPKPAAAARGKLTFVLPLVAVALAVGSWLFMANHPQDKSAAKGEARKVAPAKAVAAVAVHKELSAVAQTPVAPVAASKDPALLSNAPLRWVGPGPEKKYKAGDWFHIFWRTEKPVVSPVFEITLTDMATNSKASWKTAHSEEGFPLDRPGTYSILVRSPGASAGAPGTLHARFQVQ